MNYSVNVCGRGLQLLDKVWLQVEMIMKLVAGNDMFGLLLFDIGRAALLCLSILQPVCHLSCVVTPLVAIIEYTAEMNYDSTEHSPPN